MNVYECHSKDIQKNYLKSTVNFGELQNFLKYNRLFHGLPTLHYFSSASIHSRSMGTKYVIIRSAPRSEEMHKFNHGKRKWK